MTESAPAGPHRPMCSQESIWLHLDRPSNRLVIR
jgi:hypothetical protein